MTMLYLARFILDVKWRRKPRVCAHDFTVNNIIMERMALEAFDHVHYRDSCKSSLNGQYDAISYVCPGFSQ